MKLGIHYLLFLLLILSACSASTNKKQLAPKVFQVKTESLDWFDQARNRSVPVEIYYPEAALKGAKVVLFNHGYGGNKGGDNKRYSYLTKFLASQGYFVASIQHELPTDELLPTVGKPQEVRRPNWERGVQNMLFVIDALKQHRPELDYQHLAVIGHSNGGDMAMLFAHLYPQLTEKVISLDNRRMPLPRTCRPIISSLRSSDQPADEGVLPTLEEQQKLGMTIIQLPQTIHNDMDDDGTAAQHQEINSYVLTFLVK